MNELEESLGYMKGGYEPAYPTPSRTTPSGAVTWAWETLKQKHVPLRTAIDIGCGKGRNTLFLARKGLSVTAMDFTPQAIASLQKSAIQQKLQNKIRAFVQDVTEGWPIKSKLADLVIDTFCFKHLASQEACEEYKTNLLRVLDPRGHYLISMGSIGDGYYGRYERAHDQMVMPVDEAVKIDPINSVESTLFNREKIIKFFAPELEVCGELKSLDPLKENGDTYALLMRRSATNFYD